MRQFSAQLAAVVTATGSARRRGAPSRPARGHRRDPAAPAARSAGLACRRTRRLPAAGHPPWSGRVLLGSIELSTAWQARKVEGSWADVDARRPPRRADVGACPEPPWKAACTTRASRPN